MSCTVGLLSRLCDPLVDNDDDDDDNDDNGDDDLIVGSDTAARWRVFEGMEVLERVVSAAYS